MQTAIYQTEQIRLLERSAEQRFGISPQALMHRAGKVLFDCLLHRWPQARHIAIFCGIGNNGGDGYVLARLIHQRGLAVTVWQVGDTAKLKDHAKEAWDLCQQEGVHMLPFHLDADFPRPDVVVDAVFGIGLHRDLDAQLAQILEKMQQYDVPVLAVDIPSGIHADTGRVCGHAVRATVTVTFMGLKLGLLTGSGIAYTGELICNDLQLPAELFSAVAPAVEKIQQETFSLYCKPRPRDWHKGLSGHVLIVGGEVGLSGAPRMAAEAALRVGAGLVSVATHQEHAAVLNASCPEIMCHGVTAGEALQALMAKADVIVLGPGLGQTEWSKAICQQVLASKIPLVVDADGLNFLVTAKKITAHTQWVLTPHPGEAARLLGQKAEDIQHDRLSALKALQSCYSGTVVLKGAGSLVLSPDSLPALCDKGNPGMASAGMGDVLSGVIGGLVAQGIPLDHAAKWGVYLHAVAGDLAAHASGERGLMATDLFPYLHQLRNAQQ